MSYPIKFCRHILHVKAQDCLSCADVSLHFSVGIASVKRWSKQLKPKSYKPHKDRKVDLDALCDVVRTYPDAYQYEHAEWFEVTRKAIWQVWRKIGVTYKTSAEASVNGQLKWPTSGQ
jgi:transposase